MTTATYSRFFDFEKYFMAEDNSMRQCFSIKTECSKGSAENDVTSVVIDRYRDLQGPEKK